MHAARSEGQDHPIRVESFYGINATQTWRNEFYSVVEFMAFREENSAKEEGCMIGNRSERPQELGTLDEIRSLSMSNPAEKRDKCLTGF
jgi:hypothetical protein